MLALEERTARAVRRRALHEAGHGVFMWRSGEQLYSDWFCDEIAPFDEIIVGTHDPLDENPPPLILATGRLHNAAGAVVSRDYWLRTTVPGARQVIGMPRRRKQFLINDAKKHAGATIVSLLAGPMIEMGNDYGWFYWPDYLIEEQECEESNGDITKALQVAEQELCRGRRHAARRLDEAVEYIETQLKQDPRYWRTIYALADTLVVRLRLDHDEAVSVMRAAWHGGALHSDQSEAEPNTMHRA